MDKEIKMWSHFCAPKETVIATEVGSPCNWGDVTENVEKVYQGLYWAYPLKQYLRWPQYMEYYYWRNKKSS